MRGGAEATCQKRKDFKQSGLGQESHSWVIAPLCAGHKNDWLLRGLVVPLTLVVWLILSCAGMISAGKENAGISFLVGIAGFALWIVLSLVLHYTSIHAKRISGSELVLRGVAEEFVQAVQQYRQSPQHGCAPSFPGGGLARNQLRLTRAEIEAQLPPVCMRCGAPAEVWKECAYSTSAETTAGRFLANAFGVITLGVLGAGLFWHGKRHVLKVRVPLCGRHSIHWLWRTLAIISGFVALALLGIGVFGLVDRSTQGWVSLASFIGFVIWVPVSIYLHESSIQPLEVRPDAITLKGLSEDFIQAVEKQRQQAAAAGEYFGHGPPEKP
jgi:hypothetical protein